jgi:hypothetical protein
MIAAHTRGVINSFEIVNEPDGGWAFLGSPQQYAMMLSASYDAIHAANPRAQVALGGLMNIGTAGRNWVNAVLSTPGADAGHKFDIANIHVRTAPAEAGSAVRRWRRYFATKGFQGPLWVTETGYPADSSAQTYPGYLDGPPAQARYLATAIPSMICAGASKVSPPSATHSAVRSHPKGSCKLRTPSLPFRPSRAVPASTRSDTLPESAGRSLRRRTGSGSDQIVTTVAGHTRPRLPAAAFTPSPPEESPPPGGENRRTPA